MKIYIPIWLDLLCKSYVSFLIFHLIYIPIWLDLLYSRCNYDASRGNIYIPIWLDLLLTKTLSSMRLLLDLHSNMVRFIIYYDAKSMLKYKEFTFQYG